MNTIFLRWFRALMKHQRARILVEMLSLIAIAAMLSVANPSTTNAQLACVGPCTGARPLQRARPLQGARPCAGFPLQQRLTSLPSNPSLQQDITNVQTDLKDVRTDLKNNNTTKLQTDATKLQTDATQLQTDATQQS